MWVQNKNRGFTIVELLIVVVVIAILAAITIVSYNGITQRAKEATVKNDAASASQTLAIDYVNTDTYPATLALANGGKGIKPSADNMFYYYLNTATTPVSYTLITCNPSAKAFYKVTDTNPTPTLVTAPAPVVFNGIDPSANKYVEGALFTGGVGPGGVKQFAFYGYTGNKITMSVSYNCTSTPTIQWQRKPSGGSFANISGANSKTYITPVLSSANDNDQYRAIVSNSAGSDQTSDTILIMDYDP